MDKDLLTGKEDKKKKASPTAQARRASSSGYQALADASPKVNHMVQMQRMADEAPVQRMKGEYGQLEDVPLEENFKDRAIGRLQQAGLEDQQGIRDDTCSSSSRWIYRHLRSEYAAGNGQGQGSLIAAMRDAATHTHRNHVFIFQVNAENIGHQFTILQHYQQATILQGYVGKATVEDSIGMRGTAHNVRGVDTITALLQTVFDLRDVFVRNSRLLYDDDRFTPFQAAHQELFGYDVSGGADKMYLQANIMSHLANPLEWQASYAEGNGGQLAQEAESRCCFLTTAVVDRYGLPDTCIELITLRHFRDTYMRRQAEGNAEIAAYYEMAPRIVDAIRALHRVEQEAAWAAIYNTVRFCVESVHAGENALAHETYKAQVLALQARYLKPTPIPSM